MRFIHHDCEKTMSQHSLKSSVLDAYPGRAGVLLLMMSLAALGLISIATGDFAFQWQPVPAELPGRALLARIVGTIEVLAAVAVLVPRWSRVGTVAIAAIFWSWLLLLHVPRVLRGEPVAWLGACELLTLCGASLVLLGAVRSADEGNRDWRMCCLVGKLCFGVALPPLGLSHFLYAEPAAALIPAWFPARLFFTYLTGVGHIAAGLSILSGVLARIAAPLLALMFGCFIIFLHIPRVIASPIRYEWTMLLVSLALSGAAWIIVGLISGAKKTAGVAMALEPATR
jgi:uncharacterized membrane protein YphA (DoxX/SURF4 family)